MHFKHSLGSVNISGGGFIDLGDGMDWGWGMGMNGEIHGRKEIFHPESDYEWGGWG